MRSVGAGALWVTTRGGTLTRIDPNSGAESRVEVGGRPGGVVVAFGSVWVSLAGADQVVRVSDDDHPHVLCRVNVGAHPEGITRSAHALWVANSGDGTLSQIVVSAGAVRPTRTVPDVARAPVAVAVGDDAVWVADRADNTLVRVNGGTLRRVATIPVGAQPDSVAVVGRYVWVATAGDGRVRRVRPTRDSGVGAGSVRVGGHPSAMASGAGRLWVTDDARNQLIAVDPGSVRVTGRQAAPLGPTGLAVDRNVVWVAGHDADRVTPLHG